jgi:hypothetical protein
MKRIDTSQTASTYPPSGVSLHWIQLWNLENQFFGRTFLFFSSFKNRQPQTKSGDMHANIHINVCQIATLSFNMSGIATSKIAANKTSNFKTLKNLGFRLRIRALLPKPRWGIASKIKCAINARTTAGSGAFTTTAISAPVKAWLDSCHIAILLKFSLSSTYTHYVGKIWHVSNIKTGEHH